VELAEKREGLVGWRKASRKGRARESSALRRRVVAELPVGRPVTARRRAGRGKGARQRHSRERPERSPLIFLDVERLRVLEECPCVGAKAEQQAGSGRSGELAGGRGQDGKQGAFRRARAPALSRSLLPALAGAQAAQTAQFGQSAARDPSSGTDSRAPTCHP
jgi:hypothetical protein